MTDPHEPIGSAAEEAAKLFGALSDWAHDVAGGVDQHLATGAPECTYCPICRTVHFVREASPEIRAHLATAAASLLQAAAGILNAVATPPTSSEGRSGEVEHIDLDDDGGQDWPEEEHE